MGVKEVAIQRAVQLLNSAGVQYKIISDAGEYGDLQVVKKPERIMKNTYKHLYNDQMLSMNVGDVYTWQHDNPDGLRSAITATACNRWGRGSVVSSVSGNTVEILRVL